MAASFYEALPDMQVFFDDLPGSSPRRSGYDSEEYARQLAEGV